MNMWLAIVFGIVFISGVILTTTWMKSFFDTDYNHDLKFRLTTGGLVGGTMGVTILALNRTINALFGEGLYAWVLGFAGTVMALAMAILMRGTITRHPPYPLIICGILSILWTAFCVWWFL